MKIHRKQIAELLNINKETLRYYENVGLITPNYDQNGYRCYTIGNVYDLNTILLLRKLNIPVKDIQKNMKEKNLNDYTNVLKKSKLELEDKINQLKNLHQYLENKIDSLENINKNLNKIIFKNFSKRYALYIGEVNYSTDEIKFVDNIFKNILLINNFQNGNWIYMQDEKMITKNIQKLYILLNNIDIKKVNQEKKISCVEEGYYLCYLTKGNIKFINEKLSYLLDWIKENNYKMRGPIYQIDVPDFLLYSNENNFVVDFQIPIVRQ